MTNASRLTAVQELQKQIQSLSGRYGILADSVQDQVIAPLTRGLPPDAATVDELRVAIAEYQAVADEAAGLQLAEQIPVELPELLRRIGQVIERESWETIRAACRPDAERILHVIHKSGQSLPFLQKLHGHARECLDELALSVPPVEATWEAWQDRVRPFRDLWVLLNEPDTLSDSQAEEALGRLERDFGRGLVSAITLRRLVIRSDFPAELTRENRGQTGEPTLAESPEANESANFEALQVVIPQHERETTSSGVVQFPDHREEQSSPEQVEQAEELATKQTEHESPRFACAPSSEPVAIREPIFSAKTNRVESTAPPIPPPPEVEVVTEPKSFLSEQRCSELRGLIWGLVVADRIGLAYQLARCAESLALPGSMEPSALLLAAALGPSVRSSSGELVDRLRRSLEELQLSPSSWRDTGEHSLAARLLVLGLALRPTLLAPSAGALALLEESPTMDRLSQPLGEIRRSIAEFGGLNLELSPSVLKGVCDHAVWQQQVDELRGEARAWLESNRLASIIYAPTTEVWHRWLERDRPLGRTLDIMINQQVHRAEEVRRAVHHWSEQKNVEKELARTDEENRKNMARRRPIEARARTAIGSRVQDFVQLSQRWLDLLAAEPRPLDDFRQQRADRCRNVVQRFLPAALADMAALADAGGTFLSIAGAVQYVSKALEDIGHLFDPQRQENAQALPMRVLLGEELLALPQISLDQEWQPVAADPELLLRWLEEAVAESYDAETAFARQSERRNHLGTQRVIEALAARPESLKLAERLRVEREDQVIHCRQALRRKLDETRQLIEQAVCYDLITDEERARFMGAVEEGRLLMDEVADFGSEQRRLDDIDQLIAKKRQQRIREVHQKLSETTVPDDRREDLGIVRQALDRGDFLSADEYMELVRKGQPLVRAVEPA